MPFAKKADTGVSFFKAFRGSPIKALRCIGFVVRRFLHIYILLLVFSIIFVLFIVVMHKTNEQ